MSPYPRPGILVAVLALVIATYPVASDAGLGDKLKKKAEDKANKKADDALNKKTDTSAKEASTPAESGKPAESAATSGDKPAVSAVSTKFDFVPGDKVLLFDDFSEDELGDFPAHWKLNAGTVETAEMDGERWLRLAGDYGRVRPKVNIKLPEFWTLEFDINTTAPGASIVVRGIVEGNVGAWGADLLQYGNTTVTFQAGSVNAVTEYEGGAVMTGRHHVMVMARGTALKIYVDTQRVINVPDVTEVGAATEVQIEMSGIDSQPMITNVRFAEGNKPTKDPFAAGKFVTYGIYFDSGSDVVKAESAPVLRQMAAYLEANAAVKVQIDGHTDNQGTAAGNLDLSKRRAASVARILSDQFKIAADRFKTDGLGDTKPVASNDNAEGRATNRRVEFTKLGAGS